MFWQWSADMGKLKAKVFAATANCGNGTLGNAASRQLLQSLLQSHSDLLVLNLQEAHLANSVGELQLILDDINHQYKTNYQIISSELMMTRTKLQPASVLAGSTGIATIAIYDANSWQPKFSTLKSSRRQNNYVVMGSGSNKGGSSVNLIMHSKVKPQLKPLRIQCLSGHLDSWDIQNRLLDWQTFRANAALTVDKWSDLVERIPDVLISGYDANTRNIIIKKQAVNPWLIKYHPAITPMKMTALGGEVFSQDSTYKTLQHNVLSEEDKKRLGLSIGGVLDFIVIQNNLYVFNKEQQQFYQYSPIAIAPESKQTRDHSIIGSNVFEAEAVDDFLKVKNHIINQLNAAAPLLCRELDVLESSKENQDLLLMIYQIFLAPNGLLNYQITRPQATNKPWFEKASILNLDIYHILSHHYQRTLHISAYLNIDGWFTPPVLNAAFKELLIEVESMLDNFQTMSSVELSAAIQNTDKCIKKLNDAYQASSWWRNLNAKSIEFVNCYLDITKGFFVKLKQSPYYKKQQGRFDSLFSAGIEPAESKEQFPKLNRASDREVTNPKGCNNTTEQDEGYSDSFEP